MLSPPIYFEKKNWGLYFFYSKTRFQPIFDQKHLKQQLKNHDKPIQDLKITKKPS
jgi:hypothetical protein